MDCRRRSAVDDVRSRRWVVDDDRYPWEVDEDRRRRRSAIEEDRRRRRRAVDDDRRRRRRWEVDDYPPLELPLKWRDPPPEYPPLELPLKWRNPLPDHLTCNQPTAVVRDSPLLRRQPVGPNFASASSRKQHRNSAHIPLQCPSMQSRYQIATKPTREISSACDTLDSDRLPLRSYNPISLLRAPPEPIDSLPPLTPPRPLSLDLPLRHTTSPKSSMIVPLPLRHANNESAPGDDRDPVPGDERDLAPGDKLDLAPDIQPIPIACDFASDSSSLPIPDEATAAVIVQTHDFAPTFASSDDQNSDSDSLHEDSVAATPPLPPTQIELPLPLPFCSRDLASDVEPDLSRAHSNSSSQRQFSDQKGEEDDSVDFYSGTAIAAAAYAILLAEEGLLGKKKPIDEPGSYLTRSKSRREVCDDLLALSIAEMSINDVEVCGKATRSGIGNYFIAGVEMPDLDVTERADPTQRSQVVRQNASEGFDPKFVIKRDEFNVTHGDSERCTQCSWVNPFVRIFFPRQIVPAANQQSGYDIIAEFILPGMLITNLLFKIYGRTSTGIEIDDKKLVRFVEHVDKDDKGIMTSDEWKDFLLLYPLEATIENIYHYLERVCLEGISMHVNASKYLIAGRVAGAAFRTLTAPLDRLKVVMQVQTKSAQIIPAIEDIWLEGCLLGLFREKRDIGAYEPKADSVVQKQVSKLLDEVPQRITISWNAMVQVHINNHFLELVDDYWRTAFQIFDPGGFIMMTIS